MSDPMSMVADMYNELRSWRDAMNEGMLDRYRAPLGMQFVDQAVTDVNLAIKYSHDPNPLVRELAAVVISRFHSPNQAASNRCVHLAFHDNCKSVRVHSLRELPLLPRQGSKSNTASLLAMVIKDSALDNDERLCAYRTLTYLLRPNRDLSSSSRELTMDDIDWIIVNSINVPPGPNSTSGDNTL